MLTPSKVRTVLEFGTSHKPSYMPPRISASPPFLLSFRFSDLCFTDAFRIALTHINVSSLVLILVGLLSLIENSPVPSAINFPGAHYQLRHSPAFFQRSVLAASTILVTLPHKRTLAYRKKLLSVLKFKTVSLTPPLP